MIIAIEGLDGAGKSVQFQLLRKRLSGSVLELSFPRYDTFIGREIGAMLSGVSETRADRVDAKSMALWYASDRAMCFNSLDRTAYDHILLNRYTLANAVYQSLRVAEALRSEFCAWVFALEHGELNLPQPDHYIILDIDTEHSADNIRLKGHRDYTGDRPDVYENDRRLQEDVRKLYRRFALELENASLIECVHNNRLRTPEEINFEIAESLGLEPIQ